MALNPKFIDYLDEFIEYVTDSYNITPNAGLDGVTTSDEEDAGIINYDELEALQEEAESEVVIDRSRIKVLFNRFLEDVRRRHDLIKNFEEDELTNAISEIQKIRAGASELTLLGRLASLNQGIKTQIFEQVDFLESITKNIDRIIKFNKRQTNIIKKYLKGESLTEEEAPELELILKGLNIKDPIDLKELLELQFKKFDLNEFVNNPKAKNNYIRLCGFNCKFVNVLEVISSVPHFSKMLETFSVNNDILNNLTLRRKDIQKISEILKDNGLIKSLDKGTTTKINKFLTDCIVNNFLSNVPPFTIPNVKRISNRGILVDRADENESLEIDLSNLDDRITFKN